MLDHRSHLKRLKIADYQSIERNALSLVPSETLVGRISALESDNRATQWDLQNGGGEEMFQVEMVQFLTTCVTELKSISLLS